MPETLVDELLEGVFTNLLEASSYRNRLTGRWEYLYGTPLSVSDGRPAYGGHKVSHLLDVLFLIRQRLVASSRAACLRRLADPINHVNVLTEFAPILRLDPRVHVNYEVTGQGIQGTDIDWQIIPSTGPTILIEQKNRLGIMAEELTRLDAALVEGKEEIPEPDHDPTRLFASVERKFECADPAVRLQGAWIHVWYAEHAEGLKRAFESLHPDRVHFAILADWGDDVYLLARDGIDREWLLKTLGVVSSERFLTS